MDSWHRSDVTYARMEGLIKCGLLHRRTDVAEWLVPDREEAPVPPDGYVISFTLFHERGLVVPPHPFFWLLRASPRSIIVPIMIYVDITHRCK